MQIQSSNNKNSFRFEKLKLKNLKLAPLYDNITELAKKKDKKDKKRGFENKDKNILKSKKNKFRPLVLISLKSY